MGYDIDGDGQADVAVIDMDDNLKLSNGDIVFDRDGNIDTLAGIPNHADPNQMAAMDIPDAAPDASDYTSNANLEMMT